MTDTIPTDTPVSGPDGDPEAPYGRKADGTPKRGPGGRPTGSRIRKRASRSTSRPTPAPSRSRKPNTPRAKPVDYTETAQGLVQLVAGVVGALPFEDCKLDALVLHMRAAEAAELVNESAHELPWLGAALDKWNAYTPWAKPFMFITSLAAQFAVNHRRASVAQTRAFGTVSRDDLATMAHGMAPEPAPAASSSPEPSAPAPAEPDQPTDTNGYQPDPGPQYANVYMHPTGV